MRSTNAESQERLFSQAKHISQRTTNRKPENVLPTIILSLQARPKCGEVQQSLVKQESVVSSVSKCVLPFEGTKISKHFLESRKHSWQAHLHRISPFLMLGENVWWSQTETEFQFFDSDTDPEQQPEGPSLLHFRDHMLPDIFSRHTDAWNAILQDESIVIPALSIRLYDNDGNFTGTRYYPPRPDEPQQQQATTDPPNLSTHNQVWSKMDREMSQCKQWNYQLPYHMLTVQTQKLHMTSQNHKGHYYKVSLQSLQNSQQLMPVNSATLHHTQGVKLYNPRCLNNVPCCDDATPTTSLQCEMPSTDATMAESNDVSVNFNVDDTHTLSTKTTFRTKTATMLHRVLGDNKDILLIDNLRVTLKEKQQNKCKPS